MKGSKDNKAQSQDPVFGKILTELPSESGGDRDPSLTRGQGDFTEEEAFVFWPNFCCQVAV